MWWRANVTSNRGGDRKSSNQNNRSVILVSANQAEKATGITVKQVSRWGRRLEEVQSWIDTAGGLPAAGGLVSEAFSSSSVSPSVSPNKIRETSETLV